MYEEVNTFIGDQWHCTLPQQTHTQPYEVEAPATRAPLPSAADRCYHHRSCQGTGSSKAMCAAPWLSAQRMSVSIHVTFSWKQLMAWALLYIPPVKELQFSAGCTCVAVRLRPRETWAAELAVHLRSPHCPAEALCRPQQQLPTANTGQARQW